MELRVVPVSPQFEITSKKQREFFSLHYRAKRLHILPHKIAAGELFQANDYEFGPHVPTLVLSPYGK